MEKELAQNYELPILVFCLLTHCSQLKEDVTRVIMVCEFSNFLYCLVYHRLLSLLFTQLLFFFAFFVFFFICFLSVMIVNGLKTVATTIQWNISLVGKSFRCSFMAYTMQNNVENFMRWVLRWKDMMPRRSSQSKMSSEKKPMFFNEKGAFSQWIMLLTSLYLWISLAYVVINL